MMSFLKGNMMSFDYYEDDKIKMIEIPIIKNTACMGIIISKTKDIEIEKIKYYISQMKNVVFNVVAIPMFVQNFKIRYTDLLKETGLDVIFKKMSCPNLFQEEFPLTDVIQNIHIGIENKFHLKRSEMKNKTKTNRMFIANIPFTYYFRLKDSNTVFYTGKY